MDELSGSLNGAGKRIAIVASKFNEPVVEKLVIGARDALMRNGVSKGDMMIVWVPGAWELPAATCRLLDTGEWDAIVAIGAVIRGDTPHFDYVAGECSRGLAQAQTDYGKPIGFGVLTTDTLQQAEARAGGDHGNKGWDAAMAALEMANLFDIIAKRNET